MEQYDNEVLDFLNETNAFNIQRTAEVVNLVENQPRKYTVRKRLDPFVEYDDLEFQRRYRMSKANVWKIYDLIDGRNTLEPQVCMMQFEYKSACIFHK